MPTTALERRLDRLETAMAPPEPQAGYTVRFPWDDPPDDDGDEIILTWGDGDGTF